MRKRLSATHQIMPSVEQVSSENTAFIHLAQAKGLSGEPQSGASFAHNLVASPGPDESQIEFQTPTLEKSRRISGEELEICTEEDT